MASLHQFRCWIPYLGAIICVVEILIGVSFKRCESDGKILVATEG